MSVLWEVVVLYVAGSAIWMVLMEIGVVVSNIHMQLNPVYVCAFDEVVFLQWLH